MSMRSILKNMHEKLSALKYFLSVFRVFLGYRHTLDTKA